MMQHLSKKLQCNNTTNSDWIFYYVSLLSSIMFHAISVSKAIIDVIRAITALSGVARDARLNDCPRI